MYLWPLHLSRLYLVIEWFNATSAFSLFIIETFRPTLVTDTPTLNISDLFNLLFPSQKFEEVQEANFMVPPDIRKEDC